MRLDSVPRTVDLRPLLLPVRVLALRVPCTLLAVGFDPVTDPTHHVPRVLPAS
jgi:hypothetical protein